VPALREVGRPRHQRRRAALGVALASVVALGGCGMGGQATTVPSPIAATPPQPTAAPSPEPTVEATQTARAPELPSAACCRGRELEAGRYRLPSWLRIPLAVDIPDGWRAINEPPALLGMIGRGSGFRGIPTQLVAFINATGAGPAEQIVRAVHAAPQLTEIGAPAATAIAGLSGWDVAMQALPNPDYEGDPSADIPPGVQLLPVIQRHFAEGFIWTTYTPEARLRVVALEVGDQTLLLYLEAPTDEFDAFLAEVEPVLASLGPNGT
jgi:hypothetical protein